MRAWRDLVTASLIGTERAAVPALRLPGLPPAGAAAPADGTAGHRAESDPAAVLLDLAVLATAARRACRRPGPARPLPASDPDPRPLVSPAAASRLARLLGVQRLAEYPGLLPEWLAAAARRGLRPPPEFLPALLDRARRAGPSDGGLRRLAAEAGGPRARWLAAMNPDWAFVTELDRTGPGQPEIWRLGDTTQRLDYLAWLRAADPAAARDLVLAGWDAAPARERLGFLTMLAGRLGAGDEPLLETALTDRSADVRARAAALLARLPGSALGRRMTRRALAFVRIEPGPGGPRLTVTLPAERDEAMARDGIPPLTAAPGSQQPDRARLLYEIVARAPLRAWTADSGLTPAQLAALPGGEWAPMLLAAWGRAAVAQRDPEWTAALIRRAADGQLRLTAAQLQLLRELARQADPELGAPGALPDSGPGTPPAVAGVLAALRFRWDMLEELAHDGNAGEEHGHDDRGR